MTSSEQLTEDCSYWQNKKEHFKQTRPSYELEKLTKLCDDMIDMYLKKFNLDKEPNHISL
jgi:hypothetical protein